MSLLLMFSALHGPFWMLFIFVKLIFLPISSKLSSRLLTVFLCFSCLSCVLWALIFPSLSSSYCSQNFKYLFRLLTAVSLHFLFLNFPYLSYALSLNNCHILYHLIDICSADLSLFFICDWIVQHSLSYRIIEII